MSRMWKVLALVAILAVVGTACGGGDGDTTAKVGGDVVAGLNDPGSLDPAYCTTTTCSEPNSLLFDSLLNYNYKTAKLEKTGAASNYTVSADSKTYTFTLRQGATFHNGEAVDAESFVRALTRVAVLRKDSDPSELSYHLAGIKGFDAAQAGTATTLPGVRQGKDANELVIELESANADFAVRLGHQVFSPVPKAANLASGAPDPKFGTNPVGNGPYKIEGSYTKDVGLKVVKFAAYNGAAKGNLNSVQWKVFADLAAEYLDFQGGTLDFSSVPPESYSDAETKFGNAFIQQQGPILTYLAVNTTRAPTNNAKFRQAVSQAIDRDAIIKAIFNGARVPATSIVPPVAVGHRPGICAACKLNLDAAKKLLAEVPGATTTEIQLTYNADGGHAGWIQAVESQLKDNLGLRTKLVPVAKFDDYVGGPNVFMRRQFLARPTLARLGWAQDYPTPENWLAPLFKSGAGDNYTKYSNPAFDKLVDQAIGTTDTNARIKLFQQAEDIIIGDLPIIPMFYSKSAVVYKASAFANFPIDLQYAYPAWEFVEIK